MFGLPVVGAFARVRKSTHKIQSFVAESVLSTQREREEEKVNKVWMAFIFPHTYALPENGTTDCRRDSSANG